MYKRSNRKWNCLIGLEKLYRYYTYNMNLKVFLFAFALICAVNGVHGGFSSVCEGMDNISGACKEFGLLPQCNSKIYCYGELLCTIQLARIFPDSKTFVDMKLKYSENIVLENFRQWKVKHPKPTADDVRQFVKVSNTNF